MLDAHPGSGHAVRHARVRVCVRVRGVFWRQRGPIRASGRASAIGRGALTRAPPARARSAPVVTTLPPHETRGAPRTRACVCGCARGYFAPTDKAACRPCASKFRTPSCTNAPAAAQDPRSNFQTIVVRSP